MDFLGDFWEYCSCYEIPRNYALWSGLATVSATVHRQIIFMHGDIEITGMEYIGLIGAPGGSKSTVSGFARDIFREANPNLKIGPSRASPEVLVKIMAAADFGNSYTNHLGESDMVKAYAFFINEFQNFLGRSPFDMIALITDIFDQKYYDGSTIVRGSETIVNPAVTILMCAPPDWFIENIKGTLISGGIARRFVMVYETYGTEAKPDIIIPPPAAAAKQRVIQRLKDSKSIFGVYKWGSGHEPYVSWYHDNFARRAKESNKIMQGYLKSKNVHLYKIMMLLDVVSDKPMFVFSRDLFDTAVSLLDAVEPNMSKLSVAAGRNTLMGPQTKILELLEANGGWMPEKQLKREIQTEMSPLEIMSTLRHLEDSEQILQKHFEIPNSEGTKIQRLMVLLPSKYHKMKTNGEIVSKPKLPPSSATSAP